MESYFITLAGAACTLFIFIENMLNLRQDTTPIDELATLVALALDLRIERQHCMFHVMHTCQFYFSLNVYIEVCTCLLTLMKLSEANKIM